MRPASTAEIGKKTINKQIDVEEGYSGVSSVIDGLILEYSFTRGKKKSKKVTAKVVVRGPTLETIVTPDYKEPRKGVFINQKTIGAMSERFNNIQIKKRTDRIVKVLRQIEPSALDLTLGTNNIIYCDIGLDRLIPVNVMGGGMYRLLSIVLAISDTQDGIVLIDEVENGFSYTSQELLWNAIFESAKEFNVQIFATTHSAECVKAFSSSYAKVGRNTDGMKLYRIEKKGDIYRAVSYDHKTLETSLESGWEVR
jgi:predicted ATP-dependent endonuclease of OLD family